MNYKIYTPENYAVEMAGLSLEQRLKRVTESDIMELKVVDLSCGTGNLLLPILEQLLKKTKEIFGEYRYSERWITGYDLDREGIKLFEERLKELLLSYGFKIERFNLYVTDSLIADIEEQYDIVIGNPPYLGEKNHKELFQTLREVEIGKKYYSSKMDYFYFFICKGIDILKDGGNLIYLTTNYWLKADSGSILRKKLKDEGSYIKIKNFSHSVFKEATGQHNIIFLWEKSIKNEMVKIIENEKTYLLKQDEIYDEFQRVILIPPTHKLILDKIKKSANCRLKDLVNINQGIVSGADKVFVLDEFQERFKRYLKPFYKNKDINRYFIEKNRYWILYIDEKTELTKELIEYLTPYKELLSKRREVKTGSIKWWELQWSREEEIFNLPKIVVRQRCKENYFSYNDKSLYGSADIYYLTSKREDVDLFYILGYLNSKLFLFWYNYYGKRKGINLEYYSTPLKEIPLYYPENNSEREYISNLVKEQLISYDEKRDEMIDSFFKKYISFKKEKF